MDLKVIQGSADSQLLYREQLSAKIEAYDSKLISSDVWDEAFVKAIKSFTNEHVGINSPIEFTGLPLTPQLELKCYWAKFLSDERNNSRSSVERRRLPMRWLNTDWEEISSRFGVSFLADISHPEFKTRYTSGSEEKFSRKHNAEFLDIFSRYSHNSKRKKSKQSYVRDNSIVEKEYLPGRITVAGDIHKNIIIQREQFKPLHRRMIVYLNDIYSEDDYRFKDTQRTTDKYLNFYRYPEWLRDAVRFHVINKIQHGELAPSTLVNYMGRFINFRDFMHEKFETPSPALISDDLVENEYLAWGNRKGLSGKNWFTDTVAMLQTASREFSDKWPSLSVSKRAAKKIKKTHYKEGLGRIGYTNEGVGRSYSQRIIDELQMAVKDAPSPVPQIFTLILATGMRAEDGHSVLFDCLKDDPDDNNFMILHFWQNKVRKWNRKPLSKSDKSHAALIKSIEDQRKAIVQKHGSPTKYLFPYVTGTRESFVSQHWTASEIKKKVVSQQVRDDEGNPLTFSWHPLRHTMGTSLAQNGHDILNIMMELGHTSPDMATVYVNNRLELKKKALLEKGSGRFFTIHGSVDDKIGELLVRKEQLAATRVCGGACSMPAQIGDWCEHANACYTCKHFRADAKDVEFFKSEKIAIDALIQEQQEESKELAESGKTRMSEITGRRLRKNKEVYNSLGKIVSAIEEDGIYKGAEQKVKQIKLEFVE
ncbi:tyrosine-type recombinase/integrase [Halomonas sp. HG01]|uniref:tyrosine-type recombinase/integrase n=1 Tax=Halomonas sp. HG01 TaxID=1609967 RepID=UPI00061464D0|nr:tyrosine-type recombinase/integrase [Halomonas sp. HG01]